jgi:hypothetical protein
MSEQKVSATENLDQEKAVRFSKWFYRKYRQWVRSRPDKQDDLLGFSDMLGYHHYLVLDWMSGRKIPQGPQILCVAGFLGNHIYKILDLPRPDPVLIATFQSLGHLPGSFRSGAFRVKLSQAVIEAQVIIHQKGIPAKSDEAKEIYASVFEKKELSIHSIQIEFSPDIKLSSMILSRIINAEDGDEDPLHWALTRIKPA